MRILLGFLATLALAAPTASAQSCNIGVYAYPDGTGGFISPISFTPFHAYVVMFVEDTIDAVTYNLDVPNLYDPVANPGGNLFLMSVSYGPSGSGISIDGPGGDYIGLGECTNGFNGLPVLIAHYEFLYASSPVSSLIRVNSNDALGIVQYATCPDDLKPCQIGPGLLIDDLVAADAPSWGAVKRLYDTN